MLFRSLTVVLVGHATPALADFKSLFLVQIGLMLLTSLLCARVDTRPSAGKKRLAPSNCLTLAAKAVA